MNEDLEIHSIITNIGPEPLVVPTVSYFREPNWWFTGDKKIRFGFDFGFGELGDKKLVPSPARYCPVTLMPGESTALPIATPKRNGAETIEVTYYVQKEYASRNGWWSGKITKLVKIGEGENPYVGKLEHVDEFGTKGSPNPESCSHAKP